MPTISVAIAAYNAAAYLREALESVLAQTLPPDEIVVVDDGSTDDTRAVCASFGSRLRYIHQANDGTMGAGARARALAEARGDWIAVLDHDDRWHPDKLRRQMAAVEQHPDAFAVFTGHEVFGDGSPRSASGPRPTSRVERMEAREAFHLFLSKSTYYASSALVRREFITSHGVPDTTLMGCADWDLALAIARRYPVVVVDEPLTLYRISPAQYSADLGRLGAALRRSLEAQASQLHDACPACRDGLAAGHAYADLIQGMAARNLLDGYHEAVRRGDLRKAGTLLRKAWITSRGEILRPRRFGAVLKNGLQGVVIAGTKLLSSRSAG